MKTMVLSDIRIACLIGLFEEQCLFSSELVLSNNYNYLHYVGLLFDLLQPSHGGQLRWAATGFTRSELFFLMRTVVLHLGHNVKYGLRPVYDH